MNEVATQQGAMNLPGTLENNPAMLPLPMMPKEIIQRAQEQATALMEVVEQQELYQRIRGKKFLNVDAWQLIGGFTHTDAIPVKVEQIDEDDRIRYKCFVELRDADGKVIGGGSGEAHNKEDGKHTLTEHQIGSTAQTRAISKAYRNKFSFIAKLAGYEAATAEEMEGNGFRGTQAKSITDKPEIPSQTSEGTARATTQAPQTKAPVTPSEQTESRSIPKSTVPQIDEKTDAVTVFNIYREQYLRYVDEKTLNMLASNLKLDGRSYSSFKQQELDNLLAACIDFKQRQEKEKEAEDTVKPFPTGEASAESALQDAWTHAPKSNEAETAETAGQQPMEMAVNSPTASTASKEESNVEPDGATEIPF